MEDLVAQPIACVETTFRALFSTHKLGLKRICFLAGFTDNSNVSVVPSLDGSQLLALTESVAGTHRARTGDLATLSRVHFQDDNKDILTTAHPTIMEDGSLINMTVTVHE